MNNNKFGKKVAVSMRTNQVPTSTLEYLCKLDRLATEIQTLSGFSLEGIRDLLKSGYTLVPPSKPIHEEIEGQMSYEDYWGK